MENTKRNYEQSDNPSKCKHNLLMNSCRECLFETLCRLEKTKSLDPNDN